MKKLLMLLLVLTASGFSQYHDQGWGLGFGLNSVRYTGDVVGEDLNFGGNLYVQRDLSQNSGFRFRLDYNHFTGNSIKTTTEHFNISLGYIFRFFLEDNIKPYIGTGFSMMYAKKDVPSIKYNKSNFGEISADIFFGAYFDWLPENWMLKGEFSNHTISTDAFDGVSAMGGGGLFGGGLDSYIQFEAGVIYFWDRTVKEKAPEALPAGLSDANEEAKQKNIEAKLKTIDAKLDKVLSEIEKIK
ncbi:MAG: porin family protein [Ignavibacteriaceae bacterium]|nr:porin family protein [Ignavibacteriaceae bacterium]